METPARRKSDLRYFPDAAGLRARQSLPVSHDLRVLFLTHRLPYAPNRGDRLRAFHTARVLRNYAHVDLVALAHDAEEESHAHELRDLVSSVTVVRVPRVRQAIRTVGSIASSTPLTHALLDAGGLNEAIASVVSKHKPDVVLAYCSGMARFALERPLAGIPFVLDMVDVDSAKWTMLSERTTLPMSWIYRREARLLGPFEALAANRAVASLVVNERERAALSAIAPAARVEIVGNGVDLEPLKPKTAASAGASVTFCGVMNYAPNEDGALWLGREVWPRLCARRSDARLRLVGSSPTQAVRDLSADPTIEVTGHVMDVRPYLWQSAIAVAPVRVARGVQNKVLEAVAAGLPVVITSAVAKGLPTEVLPACRVADEPDAFAAAISDLLDRSPAERRFMAAQASLESLSWEKRMARLPDLLTEAAIGRAERRRRAS